MKFVSRKILKLLDEHNGIYLNRHDVEFADLLGGSICLAASWPGTSGNTCYDLDLVLEADTIDDLVKILNISSLQQFQSITPSYLLHLYHKGKVSVNCTIDQKPYYTLNFFKIKTQVWALGDYGDGILVSDPLEKPSDFYEYLKKHARLNQVFF